MSTLARTPEPSNDRPWLSRLLAGGLTLVGLCWALGLISVSDGVYMDDDITHYAFARDGWEDVSALLHRWARPGYNIPTAAVAHYLGFDGCRVFSAVQTALTAWLAWAIGAKLVGKHPLVAVAPALVWLQPLVLKLALTTLTETTAGLYLSLGIWLYLVRWRVAGCAAISLCFVTRDEMLALAPLMAVAVLIDARRETGGGWGEVFSTSWVWGCAVATAWAPAAYFLAAWILDLPPDASPLGMFSRSYSAEYGSGPWWWYPLIWPQAATLGVPALALAGVLGRPRQLWLPAAWVGGLVALEGVIYGFGLFASGGYARFLVPVAGPLAARAGAGLESLVAGRRRRVVVGACVVGGGWLIAVAWLFGYYLPMPPTWAMVAGGVTVGVGLLSAAVRRSAVWRACGLLGAGMALAVSLGQAAYLAKPLRMSDSPMHRVILAAVRHVEAGPYVENPGISQHTLLGFLRPETDPLFSNADALSRWQQAEPGTLFFWENKYCLKPHEPDSTHRLIESLDRLGRVLFIARDGHCRAVVYLRTDRQSP